MCSLLSCEGVKGSTILAIHQQNSLLLIAQKTYLKGTKFTKCTADMEKTFWPFNLGDIDEKKIIYNTCF